MRHFIDCVKRRATPSAGITDGLAALAMAMGVRESLETGKPAELTL
jgi:hypothetical protein